MQSVYHSKIDQFPNHSNIPILSNLSNVDCKDYTLMESNDNKEKSLNLIDHSITSVNNIQAINDNYKNNIFDYDTNNQNFCMPFNLSNDNFNYNNDDNNYNNVDNNYDLFAFQKNPCSSYNYNYSNYSTPAFNLPHIEQDFIKPFSYNPISNNSCFDSINIKDYMASNNSQSKVSFAVSQCFTTSNSQIINSPMENNFLATQASFGHNICLPNEKYSQNSSNSYHSIPEFKSIDPQPLYHTNYISTKMKPQKSSSFYQNEFLRFGSLENLSHNTTSHHSLNHSYHLNNSGHSKLEEFGENTSSDIIDIDTFQETNNLSPSPTANLYPRRKCF
ncbi:probable ATP-dependent RNA helicase ddx42 [Gordionus sp. m RMFG-2023]|uniref:probable ATP-dependent RNA helicase ddx42 n=1 Tax=Gordionus sp. m RMFG-2023 TaxID=3053472 RepID=UPI0031FC4CC3